MGLARSVSVLLALGVLAVAPDADARLKLKLPRLFKRQRSCKIVVRHAPATQSAQRAATIQAKLPSLLAKCSTDFPTPKPGHVQVYRGTYTPELTQVSAALRPLLVKDPKAVVPRGDEQFLNFIEARQHAGSGYVDGVSATTSKKGATCKVLGYGAYVIAYDIPEKVFAMLPKGDPCLSEVVFKHSIPDDFAVGIVRRQTSARSSNKSK